MPSYHFQSRISTVIVQVCPLFPYLLVAAQAQEGLEQLSHIEGQEGQREEIPLIQGKELWLCFAGAAVKRYSTPKVRETQVRW